MTRCIRRLLPGVLMLALAGCQGEVDDGALAREPAAGAEPATPPAAEHDHAAVTGSGEALALRPIMQRLGSNMAGFSYALWLEDYGEMSARAAAMAEHAPIAPEEVARLQGVLGAEMAAFEAADEAVHVDLVALHDAARTRQMEAVLARLGKVQRGCTACHSRFRDRLRTDGATASP